MNTAIKGKKDYNYQPLTEAQKSTMSEDEIKKWEEKAKQGTLRNDTAISSIVSNMRTAIYSVGTDKDAKYNALFNIGITTSAEYKDGGKLVINEEKLKAAIEANPEAVSDLFTRAADTNGSGDKGGLITQLREIAKTGVDTIAAKAGKGDSAENTYTLGKELSVVNVAPQGAAAQYKANAAAVETSSIDNLVGNDQENQDVKKALDKIKDALKTL